jgi:hypothetical protein
MSVVRKDMIETKRGAKRNTSCENMTSLQQACKFIKLSRMLDEEARATRAAQLTKDILKLHAKLYRIYTTELPPPLVTLVKMCTRKESVHAAIADHVNGVSNSNNLMLAASELQMPTMMLLTRIMHYNTNVIPDACSTYMNAIKDKNELQRFHVTPYFIDVDEFTVPRAAVMHLAARPRNTIEADKDRFSITEEYSL